ncbi:MAG: hypothetical protein NTZ95_07645 [Candidatus Omnitrophica bacterium]|nr:hypothetical protein [Candidatus Omnitrophota bacterium]
MFKSILSVILVVMLFMGQTFAEAAAKAKDPSASGKQLKEDTKAGKLEDPLDKVSREDVLNKVNGILSHNSKILELLPEIQKEVKGKKTVFKTGGKEMEALSKDELIVILKKINPALLKIQQERMRKQGEQIARQHQQNMQIQRTAQQQSQVKAPTVYTPPAKQPSVPTPYRPPAGPPRR